MMELMVLQQVPHSSHVWASAQCVVMCFCCRCWKFTFCCHSTWSVVSGVLHRFHCRCRLHYIHQEKTTRYVNTSLPKTF